MILTFLFVFIVLIVKGKNTKPQKSDAIAAFAVALALLTCIQIDAYDGPCFNPAIGISQTVYQWSQLRNSITADSYLYEYLWAYTLGPALGGAIAGIAFKFHDRNVRNFDGGKDIFN